MNLFDGHSKRRGISNNFADNAKWLLLMPADSKLIYQMARWWLLPCQMPGPFHVRHPPYEDMDGQMHNQQHKQGQAIYLSHALEVVGIGESCSTCPCAAGKAIDLLTPHVACKKTCMHPQPKGAVRGCSPWQNTCTV